MSEKLKRNRKIALLEGITAGTLFGTGAIFIKVLESLGSFSVALWRVTIASMFLALFLFVLRRPLAQGFKKNSTQILVLGLLLGLHFIFFVSAVLHTTILNATVLVSTTPIWSMFVSSLFFKLKPSRLAALGIVTSFLGVGVIAYGDVSSKMWTMKNLQGDLEAVVAAVLEAFYLSYGRDTRRKVPLVNLMSTIYAFSAFTVFVGGAVTRSSFSFPTELGLILAVFGIGLLPTAIAHTFYFSSLSHLKSFETAAMALLEPVGATLLAILIFAQIPAPLFVLGAALVLVGIVSVAISK